MGISTISFQVSSVIILCSTILSTQAAIDGKIHLYKQVTVRPKTNQIHESLCSDGKKLSHPDPDSTRRYFVCQYISKADMWLIHPYSCSQDQIFNSTSQSCQEIPRTDMEVRHGIEQRPEESISKLSSAVESMADTLKMLTNKFIKMIDTTTTTPATTTKIESSGNKTDENENLIIKWNDSDTSTTTHDKKFEIVPKMTSPSSIPALESEDPGNKVIVASSDEDYSEEIVPTEQKTVVGVPITSSSGFPHPQTTNQQNRNPFFKFFLQNLLTPPAPTPPRHSFFMKPPVHPQVIPQQHLYSRLPIIHEIKPTAESPPFEKTKGDFVNLFSVLNFLTGSPSPSIDDIFNPDPSSTENEATPTPTSTPTVPHAHVNKIPVSADANEEKHIEIDLERKPVNSTTIHSNLNYSSEIQNSMARLSHSRKPRM